MDVVTSFYQVRYQVATYTDLALISSFGTSVTLYTVTYNPCSPWISVPQQVLTTMISSARWTSCSAGMWAFYDPPYVLTAGGELQAVMTQAAMTAPVSDVITTTTTGQASPGSTVAPTTATATTTQNAVPSPTTTARSLVSTDTATPSTYPTTSVSDPNTGSNPTTSTQTDLVSTDPTPATSPSQITTLTPVPSVTLPVVSLQTDGSTVVIGGSTTKVVAGSLISTGSPSTVVLEIGSQMLVAGSAATISGTPVSLETSGSSLVVGSSTAAVDSLLASGGVAIGSGIASLRQTTVAISSNGLAGAIATIGGFATTTNTAGSSKTSTSYVQLGTAGTYNGTAFVGSAPSLGIGNASYIVIIVLLMVFNPGVVLML